MSELSEIYGKSTPLWELLQAFRKATSVTTAEPGEPKSIAGRVRALEYQISKIQDIWVRVRQPQPKHEKEIYDADIAKHQKAISHLESLAKTALTDDCAEGIFIGIGFIKTYPPRSLSDWGMKGIATDGVPKKQAPLSPTRRFQRGFGAIFCFYPAFRRNTAMRLRFQARQTSVHSPETLRRPRSENWRNPITDLMMPNTGSTVCLRSA